jgi:hypothetical protein
MGAATLYVVGVCLNRIGTGRKGTGKSTVFQRAQHEIRKQRRAVSAYVDIKTVFESAAVDPGLLSRVVAEQRSMSEEQIRQVLLYKVFIRAIIVEVQSELKRQVRGSFLNVVRDKLGRGRDQVFEALDELIENSGKADFDDVTGVEGWDRKETIGEKKSSSERIGASTKLAVGLTGLAGEASGNFSVEDIKADERETESSYARVLMRTFNITGVNEQLAAIVFNDDFSELPESAMRIFVHSILAPLNNWSNELIKFKVAAYPGRIYFGKLDQLKMDEVYLDVFKLYGANDVGTMEDKAIQFTQRLLDNRFRHYCKCSFAEYCGTGSTDVVRTLFFASLGNPRTLGHMLSNLQESHVAFGKSLTSKAVRDASVKFYDEKIEP